MVSRETLAVLEDIAGILHTKPESVPSGALYVCGIDAQRHLVSVRARQETSAVELIRAEVSGRETTTALQLLNPTIGRIERPGDIWIRIFGAEGTFLISPQLGAHISHGSQQGL